MYYHRLYKLAFLSYKNPHFLLKLIIFSQLFQDKPMGTAPMGMWRISALTIRHLEAQILFVSTYSAQFFVSKMRDIYEQGTPAKKSQIGNFKP